MNVNERNGSLEVALAPSTTPMLSPENWERILSNLSPEDFRSAINTFPEWNQLMTSQKNGVLFPEIIPMLIDHLPWETILGCRQLSKVVKHATDQLLSNDPAFEDILTGGTKIARFISLMESRPFPEENPFIGRSVFTCNLQGMTAEQTNRRVEAVRQVLVRYGKHVRRFRFSERLLEFGILESYVSLLSLLPNLESITIFDCLLLNLGYSDLASLTLPKLDKLEELYLDKVQVLAICGSTGTFGLRFLDEYGHQLKSLSLDHNFLHYFDKSRSLNSLAPNLNCFEMESSDCSALNKLAAVTSWELTSLSLSGAYELEDVPDLAAAVNNFAKSLVSLRLMWNPENVRDMLNQQYSVRELVMLPKLETLDLLFVSLKVDWIWDFLKQSCKQLKTISLEANDENEVKNAEEVGLLGMYVRHLFNILPMLNKIVIPNYATSVERVIYRKADM